MNYNKIIKTLGISMLALSLSACGRPQACLYGPAPEAVDWENETVTTQKNIDFIDIDTDLIDENQIKQATVESASIEEATDVEQQILEETYEPIIPREESEEGCLSLEEAKEMGLTENPPVEESVFTDEEINKMTTVDERIVELVESEKFKNSNIEERKILSENLLKELYQEALINHYDVNDGDVLSFEYENGALGGIQIRDFDPIYN